MDRPGKPPEADPRPTGLSRPGIQGVPDPKARQIPMVLTAAV
jgi:hypothetical protein